MGRERTGLDRCLCRSLVSSQGTRDVERQRNVMRTGAGSRVREGLGRKKAERIEEDSDSEVTFRDVLKNGFSDCRRRDGE